MVASRAEIKECRCSCDILANPPQQQLESLQEFKLVIDPFEQPTPTQHSHTSEINKFLDAVHVEK
eukprot:Awhi_evm1s6964